MEHLLAKEGVAGSIPVSRSEKETDWWNTNRSLFFEPCRGSKFDVSALLRSSQDQRPPDVVRRLALSFILSPVVAAGDFDFIIILYFLVSRKRK